MIQPAQLVGRRDGAVVALGVVVGVLVLATGLFVALFVVGRGDLAEVNGRLAGVERGLTGEGDRLVHYQSSVDDLDERRDELAAAIAELRACDQ